MGVHGAGGVRGEPSKRGGKQQRLATLVKAMVRCVCGGVRE